LDGRRVSPVHGRDISSGSSDAPDGGDIIRRPHSAVQPPSMTRLVPVTSADAAKLDLGRHRSAKRRILEE
jgi:hypothetical protein